MKIFRNIGLLLACIMMLSGCGAKESEEAFNQGVSAMESGEYEQAITIFQGLADAGERASESYRCMGIAYYELGDYTNAGTMFARSLNLMETENDTFTVDVLQYQASAYLLAGDADNAISTYTTLMEYDHDGSASYARGCAYLMQGDASSAETDFDKALSQDASYQMYARIYQSCADYDQESLGEAYLTKALENDGTSVEDLYYKGWFSYDLGYYDDAESYLSQAAEQNDNDSRLLLGKVYLAMEDTDRAEAVFEEYEKSEGSNAASCNGLALCYLAQGNYDEALNVIDLGLSQDEDGSQRENLLFNQIVAYEDKLDFDTAKSLMTSFLAEFPDNQQAIRENTFLQNR